ncbi:mitochondrial import receptor subunit tom40 [Trichuris trichiura]|uniref:Mitochondrial import receptor subunit tom40 n=1 Tax=Trichuris trichiura TaxID=36087 RepID=A0A077Z1F9_TRITR|nr:mitochondrial import receptor subunit tom40 [Trichuris trichiura]
MTHCSAGFRTPAFKPSTTDPSSAPQIFPLNPGLIEDIHKKCKDVYPTCFDGAKLLINKGLSSHFQVTHTLAMGPFASGYRFGAMYVGTQRYGSESFPVFLADTDVTGNLNANFIQQLTDRLRCRFAAQIQSNKFAGVQLTTEYRTPLFTASASLVNIDLVNESGCLTCSFLRRVTPNIDAGLECAYQYARIIPGGQFSILNYALRYTENFSFSSNFGPMGVRLTYFHKQQPNLQFGVELESNWNAQENLASFAYQADVPKANASFRASIDTNFTVSAMLEKRLSPMPFTIILSGVMNNVKNVFRVGLGFVLGG